MSHKDKKGKPGPDKNSKQAGGVKNDVINGQSVENSQTIQHSQSENTFINPTQYQSNAVSVNHQQQYLQSQNQLYNQQQGMPNIAQQGIPMGQGHFMNSAGAYSEQNGQQNNMICGQPFVNTGAQAQQWAGQQNNGLFEMVQQIHQTNMSFLSRLSSIENNVAKLATIEQDVSRVRYDINNLKEENKNVTSKITELETSTQSISQMFDDCVKVKTQTENDVDFLKRENISLQSKLDESNKRQEKLSAEMLDLKARSMQENLLFFGLAEHQENGSENVEGKLREFLKNELTLESEYEIDSIAFDRVHRLGGRKMNWRRQPRPVVAKFEKYTDREKIRKLGVELNKKQIGYSVREQFPVEMEEKRKKLYPVMRQYQKNPNNKVVLIRDKLYINDTLYDENFQEQASGNGRNSRYDRSNSIPENGNNRRDYRQPIRRTAWGNSSNNRDYSQTPTMDRPLSRQRVSFESENRYENLINMDTTEMSRQLDMFVGKRKPTSPALDETSLKNRIRQNHHISLRC